MMGKTLALAGVLLMLMGSTEALAANPPTEEQKAEFYATCIKVAPKAQELCACKAEAAMKLVDTDFMAIIISSMKGNALAAEHYVAYNNYIANSNKVCKPNY